MKAIADIVAQGAKFLEQKGIANSRFEAEDLISHTLGISRSDLFLHHERSFSDAEIMKCQENLERRGNREPIAYILGQVQFNDVIIHVTPNVLIPRHETEIMTDIICKRLANEQTDGKTLVDLCTGSGCIGISIKKKIKNLNVFLADVSPEATEVAQKSAKLNDVDVVIKTGDFLDPLAGIKADYLICNPPYIRDLEYDYLEPEVRLEPRIAFTGGNDGLQFYRRLAAELPSILHPHAKVWLEIGYDQGEDVKNIFNHPRWKHKSIGKDWAGHDRFFSLEIE